MTEIPPVAFKRATANPLVDGKCPTCGSDHIMLDGDGGTEDPEDRFRVQTGRQVSPLHELAGWHCIDCHMTGVRRIAGS